MLGLLNTPARRSRRRNRWRRTGSRCTFPDSKLLGRRAFVVCTQWQASLWRQQVLHWLSCVLQSLQLLTSAALSSSIEIMSDRGAACMVFHVHIGCYHTNSLSLTTQIPSLTFPRHGALDRHSLNEDIYWEARRAAEAQRRAHTPSEGPIDDEGLSRLYDLWLPDYNCPYLKERVGNFGDGGKWVSIRKRHPAEKGRHHRHAPIQHLTAWGGAVASLCICILAYQQHSCYWSPHRLVMKA